MKDSKFKKVNNQQVKIAASNRINPSKDKDKPIKLDLNLSKVIDDQQSSEPKNSQDLSENNRSLHKSELSEEQRKIINTVIKGDRDLFISLIDAYLKTSNDLNFCDEKGWTCLHHSAEEGNLKITQLLLKLNCNINAISYKKQTPLHRAIINGYFDITKLLIENGASVFSSDDEHNNSFHLCAIEGHFEVMKYLLEHHQFTLVKNLFGKTALDLASNEKMKNLLINHSQNKSLSFSMLTEPSLKYNLSSEKIQCIVNVSNITNTNNFHINPSAQSNEYNAELYDKSNNSSCIDDSRDAPRHSDSAKIMSPKLNSNSNSAKKKRISMPSNQLSISDLSQKIYNSCTKKSGNQGTFLSPKTSPEKKKIYTQVANHKPLAQYTALKEENANFFERFHEETKHKLLGKNNPLAKTNNMNSSLDIKQNNSSSKAHANIPAQAVATHLSNSMSPMKPKAFKKASTAYQLKNVDMSKLNINLKNIK